MFSSSIAAMRCTNSALQLSQDTALQDAIAKAKGDIGRGDAHAAVRGLSAHLNGQRDFNHAILSLLDSSPSPMRQALIKEARSQRSDFDLNAHSKEGKTVLDVAVKHKDQEFARYLLCQGAKPEQVSLGTASHEMQMLLTSWRRKKLLYAHFNEANRRSWAPLDRALYEGRHEEVRARLKDMLAKNGMYKIWKEAMHAGMHDILRALLVTGTPDELRELTKHKHLVGQWKEALRDDPGLFAVLKEFPYQSAKRGAPKYFNYKAQFTDTNEPIACSHLATYHQVQQAKNPHIKFDYNEFSSPQAIAHHVKPDTERTYERLRAQASETHLIDNRKFGHFLVRQFEAMENDGKQSKLILVNSTNHTMNIGLRIKEKNGKKSYVVKFFDPNETTTNTRSKTNNAKTFETQTLASYITIPHIIDCYFPNSVYVSLFSVHPEENAQTSTFTADNSSVDRTLASMDVDNIDATVMWYLISEGFTGNLRQLHDYFISLPEDKRIESLSWKRYDGIPAFFLAMQEGKQDAVKAYGELLKLLGPIPQDKLIELITATNAEGTPALSMSMQEGHVEAIKAYGELLKQFEPIPEDHLIKLLAATDANGYPALLTSIGLGHVEAVTAYGELVKLLPPNKQVDLLLAKAPCNPYKGQNGLQFALQYCNFKAFNAMRQLLTQLAPNLSPEKRAMLQNELEYYDFIFIDADE